MKNPWVVFAGLFGLLAVGFGAFAAHGLQDAVSARALNAVHTGANYALAHAAVLLALGALAPTGSRLLRLAGWAFVVGVALFSGSLFIYGVTGITAHLWITPIGGVLLLAGWALVLGSGLAAARASD
jgi:uncharacterized membrane protein YgdD (TMEM256/DUF423 family)